MVVEDRQRRGDLRRDHREPRCGDGSKYPVEARIDVVEACIHLGKARIDLSEARIDLSKAQVDLFEAPIESSRRSMLSRRFST